MDSSWSWLRMLASPKQYSLIAPLWSSSISSLASLSCTLRWIRRCLLRVVSSRAFIHCNDSHYKVLNSPCPKDPHVTEKVSHQLNHSLPPAPWQMHKPTTEATFQPRVLPRADQDQLGTALSFDTTSRSSFATTRKKQRSPGCKSRVASQTTACTWWCRRSHLSGFCSLRVGSSRKLLPNSLILM
jgi:hypothetical protein